VSDDKRQPIVIKKIKKGGHGHHGGSWKVAYADFVTAMMAFFLLLWLLGISDENLREGTSDYFNNPAGIQGPGGASTSLIKLGGAMEIPKGDTKKREPHHKMDDQKRLEEIRLDKARLDDLLKKLKESIETSDNLKDFKDQLLLEITPEGLRIQIVDKENRPMFDLGSATLKSYSKKILAEIAKTIYSEVPNRVSISGHTDATPFARGYIEYENRYGEEGRRKYSNWELSADRANAARRELIASGMPENQLGRVIGLASSVLFDKEDPYSPVNRRISILVMNKATAEGIGFNEEQASENTGNSPAPATQ
jgi:chemotaxis protein MotB